MSKPTLRPTAFVMVATNHGSMLVNRHDYLQTAQGGVGVGFQLLNQSAFDPSEVEILLQLLDSRRKHFGDGVIGIDCGANVGVHTLEWSKHMAGWGEVLAFEAQERVFYALAGNITMNNCFNARAVWAAVGEKEGAIRVPLPNYLVPSSFGSLEIRKSASNEFIGQKIDYSDAKSVPTRMTSIDSLKLKRIDVIKIDIEGMEMEALRGAVQSIKACRPQLFIESIKSNQREILDFVDAHGYKVFPVGINFLCVHKSDPLATQLNIKSAA